MKMMIVPAALVLTVLAARSALAQVNNNNPCVTSLDYILLVERYRDASEFRTYELCSDRSLQSATPFQITKSNIHIVCTGCVVANSRLEIIGNTGGVLSNVILEGITFRSSSVNIRAAGGSVAVVECRFEQDSTLAGQSLVAVSGAPARAALAVRIASCVFLVRTFPNLPSESLSC